MKSVNQTMALCAAGAVALAGMAAVGQAKTIKLTVVGAPPPIVTPVQVTKGYFVPEVDKRIAASGKDFKIEWTQAYSFTLASFHEVLEAVEEGIADVGVQIHVFEESKLPLENISTYVPFGTADVHALTRIMRDVRKKVPEMDDTWTRLDQIYLGTGVNDTIHLMTKFPVKRYEDLKGHKLGASGTMGNYLLNTGATVVNSSMNQAYLHIKNGLYDGYPISWGLGFAYKVYQSAPYLTKVNIGAIASTGLSVNVVSWKKLPGWVQTIFREVAVGWQDRHAAVSLGKSDKFETIMVKGGAKISEFSMDERRRWAHALPNIAKQWADRLEKKGQPARRVLVAYMDGLRAAKAEIVRDWDKE